MFSEAVVQPMDGSCSVAPAGTDQLDLEAAEQLIQLSGGDGAAANDDDAGSESKSADSVKCRSKEKEKEAAVDSRRKRSAGRIPAAGTGKDGNGGGKSDDIKGVDSFACCSATAADVVEKEKMVVVVESCRRRTAAQRFPAGKKDRRDGGIVRGEARKRPRFRSLADIYRDTEPGRLTAGGGEGHADRDPPEGEKEEKKRAADGVIAVHAKASKARRSGQSAHTRM